MRHTVKKAKAGNEIQINGWSGIVVALEVVDCTTGTYRRVPVRAGQDWRRMFATWNTAPSAVFAILAVAKLAQGRVGMFEVQLPAACLAA